MYSNAQKKSQRSRSKSNQRAIFNAFAIRNTPTKETKAEKAERLIREEIAKIAKEEMEKIAAERAASETVDVQHVEVVKETE